LREITVMTRWRKLDAQRVSTEAIQHELDRIPDTGSASVALRRCHLETLLCAARLQEAIDRAERWYARREEDLRRFERRMTATARRLCPAT
jgi:hypothetical protein